MNPTEPTTSVVITVNPLKSDQPNLDECAIEILERHERYKRINTHLNNCLIATICIGIIVGILIAILYSKR